MADGVAQPGFDAIASGIRPGTVVAGKYQVEKILGSGGMGIVVEARHLLLGENVALKILRDESLASATGAARLMREARSLARLKSSHVARIFDAGEHEGMPFLVLELLEGTDLQRLVRRPDKPPIGVLVDFIAQACEGVADAHAAGIIHRDLKPQNLFVVKQRRGAGLVKVLDFGIACSMHANEPMLTQSTELVGTPHYMAPEQLRADGEVDARSDVWALGACLYAVLAGKPPFHGAGLMELGARILRDEPPPLAEARPDVPPGLAEVVARCLAKLPGDRFPSAEALAEALAPFRAVTGTAPEVTACLDDNVLAEMQDGALSAEALARVERHAASCSACRALVGAAAPASAPPATSELAVTDVMPAETTAPSLRGRRSRNVRVVAIGLAVVAVLVVGVSLARTKTPAAAAEPVASAVAVVPAAAAPPPADLPADPSPLASAVPRASSAPASDPRRPVRRNAGGPASRGAPPAGGPTRGIPDTR